MLYLQVKVICFYFVIAFAHIDYLSDYRDLETKVEWEIDEPFVIEPSAAILKSKATRQFRATFTPEV